MQTAAKTSSAPTQKPSPHHLKEAQLRDTLVSRLSTQTGSQEPQPSPAATTRDHDRDRVPSDYDLNPGMRDDEGPKSSLRAAAVLISVYFDPEPMVLFTRRTQELKHHAGQISFPGGKIDSADASPQSAALREANEELGLTQTHIEPFGFLNSYETRTGFLISPLVAFLKPGFELKPDPNEVAEVFFVPLQYLMNPANHQKHALKVGGKTRYYYALSYKTRYIWGATAGILVNMQERLFAR